MIRGKLNLAPAFVCRSYHSGKVQIDTQFLAIAMRHLLESRHLSAPYAAAFILCGVGNSRQSRSSSNPLPLPFEAVDHHCIAGRHARLDHERIARVRAVLFMEVPHIYVLGFVVVPFLPETKGKPLPA